MLNVFYGCARKHRINLPGILISYNDIDKRFGCNYSCDIRNILSDQIIPGIHLWEYDALIFTPPCNYYSRANYRRESSLIAQQTKDLLPLCLDYCLSHDIPFLVENVANKTLLGHLYPQYQFIFGNHTFWSNVISSDDLIGVYFIKNQNKNFISPSKRNDNYNVDVVIKLFLDKVYSKQIKTVKELISSYENA